MLELDKKIQMMLISINFIDRYKTLSQSFADSKNLLKDYSVDKVLLLMENLGYSSTFDQQESFFHIYKNVDNIQTHLNICLKYGLVELILGIKFENKKHGGPFGVLTKLLGYRDKILYPRFSNYEQLELILKDSLSIYEDAVQKLAEIN